MFKTNNFNSFLGSAQLEKYKSLGHYELKWVSNEHLSQHTPIWAAGDKQRARVLLVNLSQVDLERTHRDYQYKTKRHIKWT